MSPRAKAQSPPRTTRARNTSVTSALTFCAGAALTLLAFGFTFRQERARMEASFHQTTERFTLALNREVEQSRDVLTAIAGLYAAVDDVTRSEFHAFTGVALERHRGVHSFAWIPRVPNSERPAYESEARSAGFEEFAFKSIRPDGEFTPLLFRGEYYPIQFAEPAGRNRMALGLDLASDPVRAEALQRACDSGRQTATGRITLLRNLDNASGFLIFQPIYHPGTPHDTVADRRQNLQGFAVVVFRADHLLMDAFAPTRTEGINASLYTDAPLSPNSRLAGHDRHPAGHATTFHSAGVLKAADRNFPVRYVSTPAFDAQSRSAAPHVILAGGLLCSVALAWYHFRVLRRNARIAEARASLEAEIEERRQTESALRTSEARYRSLFENMLEGYARCRMIYENGKPVDFVYLDVNRSFETLTGLKNVTGKRVSEILPGFAQANPELFEVYGRAALTGAPERIETYVDALGIWFSVAVCSPEKGQFTAMFENITERRTAEEALRQSEERFRGVVNDLPIFVVRMSPDRTITFVNQAYCRYIGKSEVELLGTHDLPEVYAADQAETDEVVRALRKDRPMATHDMRVVAPNGDIRWHRCTFRALFKGDDLSEMLTVGQDITEIRALDALSAQSQKLEAIGRLSAGIAHEINTPTQYVGDNIHFLKDAFRKLNAMVERLRDVTAGTAPLPERISAAAEAEKLADWAYLSEETPKAIDQTIDGVQRISHIIRAMKEFAHPSAQQVVSTNLNRALESTCTVARNEWKYVANVVMDFAPDLPLVPCVPGDMNQVFLNVIINAAQAIGEANGAQTTAKGTITVRTRRDGDAVEVRISDTGAGIPAALRSRVFTQFFTTKGVGQGTGQGLAFARNVVTKEHGGTIAFETEEGKGTTFIIRLPLKAATIAQGIE